MGQIARALSFSRRSIENPATKWSNPAQWMVDWATGGASKAGVTVSLQNAVRMTAFWCAVRVLSETVASLPLFIYERQEPRGRVRVRDHPLSEILHLQPNPRMTSLFFRETLQAQIVVHGNGYAPIRRDASGAIRELWPLTTQNVEPKLDADGDLFYQVRLNSGKAEAWAASEILHIPGLSFDGIKGKSVISAARDAIGLGIAAQDYGAIFFGRGGRVPGVIQTKLGKLDPDTRKNVRENWLATVGGVDNWHQPAILPKEWEYKAIGIPPEDGQFLETRKFQVPEIARMFRVPPHLLYDLERATFSNIEQQSLDFVIHSIRPWLVRWEQELDRKLLTEDERQRLGLFIAFNLDGLLRGDSAARGAFYVQGRQWGWLSANDVLDMENRPGIGDKGDVYLTPMNMINAEELLGGGLPLAGPPSRDDVRRLQAYGTRGLRLRRRIKLAQKPILEDRARTIVKREIRAIEKMLKDLEGPNPRNKRNVKTLRKELDEFYAGHAEWAGDVMRPVIASYAELVHAATTDELGQDPDSPMPEQMDKFVADYSRRFGVREASEGRLQILSLTQEGNEQEVAETLRTRLGEWSGKRPAKIALRESTQFAAAASKILFVAGGVTLLRWVASADACPFCAELDGRVVGVEKDFVSAGEPIDGGPKAGPPMKPSSNVGHPPVHGGCECDIVPE